jgi:prepilin-type processing-associated H-X9-DG protein
MIRLAQHPKTLMQKFSPNKKFAAAFNLIELVVVVLVVIVLGVLATVFVASSRRTGGVVGCASNLRELGMAMTMYTRENDNRLPFAFIKYNSQESTTWDILIFPFINRRNSDIVSSSSLDKGHGFLRCPSDTIINTNTTNSVELPRRTYAMSRHSMTGTDWPPGANNNTGPGLWWSSDISDGNAALTNVLSMQGSIPAVRLDMISAPSGTLLLTEQARADNIMFNYSGASIGRSDPQFFDPGSIKVNPYHDGKFNYLMMDGHVETLLPTEKPGMWTIRPDD